MSEEGSRRKGFIPTPKGRIHRVEVRVLYADTDHGGVVYYGTYPRWFEMGRAEFLRSMDVVYADLEKQGIISPVVELRCKYHKAARYDDVLIITTWIEEFGRSSITFGYQIHRKSDQCLIVTALTINAFINRKQKCIRIPKEISEAFKNRCYNKNEDF